MRSPAARVKPRIAKLQSFPAPVGGLIKNQNLTIPGARRPDGSAVNGAAMLTNGFPIATGVRMRAGSSLYYTVGNGIDPVKSMFVYVNGNNRKFFAATENAVYDTSVQSDPVFLIDNFGHPLVDDLGNYILGNPNPPASPVVSSLSGGDWSVVQFATPGGVFLRAVNGVDTPRVYDGTTWSASPAITGVDATTLSYTFVFKRRLFFIRKDSLSAYYLPVDSIGGAVTELPLGGVFSRGGSLVFGASWSLDTGGGLSAQCAFVTTEGEVAVYQGTDPSVAASWSLVGVYRIGKPLGPKAFIVAGGDLVIATDIGFIPLSQAVQRDYAALSPNAISYPIETAWNEAVRMRPGGKWSCEVWPSKQMVLIALPTTTDAEPQMLVANARTGAWALYTGWDGTCLQLYGDRMFYGSTAGRVVEAETGGSDQGLTYTFACVPLFDPMKNPAALKIGLEARATFLATQRVAAKLSMQTDFDIKLPTAPDDIFVPAGDVWGVGIWGTSKWGKLATKRSFIEWSSIGGSGYAISPGIQISSGGISPPDVELVSIDVTFDMGDIVT